MGRQVTKVGRKRPGLAVETGHRAEIWLTLVLAGVPFIVGKYFEFNSPDPFDSAIYAYSAQHILSGAKIGVDEIPSAQIGTLLVNLLGVWLFGFSEIGPKLIQGLLQVAAFVMMFLALRRHFGRAAAAISVIVASFYLSSPMIAKYGNVKEQHMIAFMVVGVGSFLLYQASGKWWQALVAGASLSWAPLFKQTGISAMVATGLFVITQPVLRSRPFRRALIDLGLLVAGAAIALVPLFVWIIGWHVRLPLPYDWVGFVFSKLLLPMASADPNAVPADYVTSSRKLVTIGQQAAMVFRYYAVLMLPVAMGLVSIVIRVGRLVASWLGHPIEGKAYERFVLLLGIWWLLDMALVWVSPRPYEQYYLPLNASAAMLGGYAIGLYADIRSAAVYRRALWNAAGVTAVIVMLAMAFPILVGVKTSPATGRPYGGRNRGYVQRWQEIQYKKKGGLFYPWEQVADYIRMNSNPDDRIYVWGWIPGIYVRAQRFSASPVACTSEMHVYPPKVLQKVVSDLIASFKKDSPRYIVDTHNRHFPYDPPRLPLELWPTIPQKGLIPLDPNVVGQYEQAYYQMLKDRADQWPDEAERFIAMKPLRDYVMANYKPVQAFGDHVIFERKAQ